MDEQQTPPPVSEVVTPTTLGKKRTSVEIETARQTTAGKFEHFFDSLFLSVPLQERVLFARHLSVGIKAGMSLQDSLKLIQAQTKSKAFIKILDTIIADTANGMFLSASMQKYEGIFGQLFINIVRVGEQSGTLTENLSYLAKELKKKQELRSKVRGALIYPAVIFCATIGIVATLMIAVFPKILPVFANLKIKLPLTTRILIATTDFMTSYTGWIIFSVFAVIVLFVILSKYEWFKHGWHHVLLRIPVVGKIAVKVNMASVSRILGLLLKSGTQVIEAVNITADALDNRVYRHELRTAGETLRRGEFFSIYLAKEPKLFPPIFTNMIQVGENTGNLTDNLDYLSTFYEEDVDEVLKNLNSIIEPFLLLFMGLLVGFMALSVVTPIYSISQSLSR
jgi:type IV pilus assembly protein PilC